MLNTSFLRMICKNLQRKSQDRHNWIKSVSTSNASSEAPEHRISTTSASEPCSSSESKAAYGDESYCKSNAPLESESSSDPTASSEDKPVQQHPLNTRAIQSSWFMEFEDCTTILTTRPFSAQHVSMLSRTTFSQKENATKFRKAQSIATAFYPNPGLGVFASGAPPPSVGVQGFGGRGENRTVTSCRFFPLSMFLIVSWHAS